MIIGMIKAHPTENRMPRRATWPDGKRRVDRHDGDMLRQPGML
jgi:hypothetical protein